MLSYILFVQNIFNEEERTCYNFTKLKSIKSSTSYFFPVKEAVRVNTRLAYENSHKSCQVEQYRADVKRLNKLLTSANTENAYQPEQHKHQVSQLEAKVAALEKQLEKVRRNLTLLSHLPRRIGILSRAGGGGRSWGSEHSHLPFWEPLKLCQEEQTSHVCVRECTTF